MGFVSYPRELLNDHRSFIFGGRPEQIGRGMDLSRSMRDYEPLKFFLAASRPEWWKEGYASLSSTR
jgi:hypothetical protein